MEPQSQPRSKKIKSDTLLRNVVSSMLHEVLKDKKISQVSFTCSPEAVDKITELTSILMKRLMVNIQELMVSSSKGEKKKEITIDTIFKALQLTFPSQKSAPIFHEKTGEKIQDPLGCVDTLEAYIEAFLRIRLYNYNLKVKSSVLAQSDFMQNNTVVLDKRNELLFLVSKKTSSSSSSSSS